MRPAVRNEKLKVLQSVRPYDLGMVATSWCAGNMGLGWSTAKSVPGYRQEPGVNPHSRTETFVAMELLIDNWRWAGVPFYLRTGKRLAKRSTEVRNSIQTGAAHCVFASAWWKTTGWC